jgi:hypothetical protein
MSSLKNTTLATAVRNRRSAPAIAVCIFVMTLTALAQYPAVDHWETVVYETDAWKYLAGASQPDTSWKSPGFNDSAWSSGKGPVGYGGNDDSTVISNTPSVYLRTTFTIQNVADIKAVVLNTNFDDSYVAYLNGFEVARENIGSSWAVTAYNDTADVIHLSQGSLGKRPSDYLIYYKQLVYAIKTGTNTLAIQVNNVGHDTSGLTAGFTLSLGVAGAGAMYHPLPTWFVAPAITADSSNLPIFTITSAGAITNDPRIFATLGIQYKDGATRYRFGDAADHFNKKISIEIRGQSSQEFPKKCYGFTTYDSLGATKTSVSLCGLPKENDWILYASYNDKSLIRNGMTYEIARRLGWYAPRTRFCELMLNDYYQGLYVLTEKIQRDTLRVNISNLKKTDTTGDGLTGGYIISVDRNPVIGVDSWQSSLFPAAGSFEKIIFSYCYPKNDEIVNVQKTYIQNFIKDLETALLSVNFADSATGYRRYIDVGSFVDYFLMSETAKELDGYRYSVFMYKSKSTKGGKLFMGPVWDYNTGYGNSTYADSKETDGWLYDKGGARMWWFKRLMEDNLFVAQVNTRWRTLRNTVLHNDSINTLIDSLVKAIGPAAHRNFYQWQVLGRYIWPNNYIGNTYAEEIDFLKRWTGDRIAWMDANMPVAGVRFTARGAGDEWVRLYRTKSSLSVAFGRTLPLSARLSVFALDGRLIAQAGPRAGATQLVWDSRDHGHAASGIYLYRLNIDGRQVMAGKFSVMR